MLRNERSLENRDVVQRTLPKNCLTIGDVIRMRQKQDRSMNGVDAMWLRIQLEAVLNGQSALIGPFDGVDGLWKDEPCFVVGGSYNLRAAFEAGFNFKMLDGFHSIGVNHVIEDYHDFEWFLFQDARFLRTSSYDLMQDYKGRIFGHIRTHLTPSDKVTIFYTQDDGPAEHIIQGLFTFLASGITAINLALISGARPIYLLGVDTGGLVSDDKPAHYKDTYPGEVLNCAHWDKYKTTIPERMLRYAPFADRFVNVDPLGAITVFKKMDIREVPELQEKFV